MMGRACGCNSRAIALARMRCPAPTPLLVTMMIVGRDTPQSYSFKFTKFLNLGKRTLLLSWMGTFTMLFAKLQLNFAQWKVKNRP